MCRFPRLTLDGGGQAPVGRARQAGKLIVARAAVRAIDCDGVGQASGVIAGLDWLLGLPQLPRPALVSMSLGVADVEDILNKAVSAVLQQGITVVTAAGNENSGAVSCYHPFLE